MSRDEREAVAAEFHKLLNAAERGVFTPDLVKGSIDRVADTFRDSTSRSVFIADCFFPAVLRA